jgi:hypothetical protein
MLPAKIGNSRGIQAKFFRRSRFTRDPSLTRSDENFVEVRGSRPVPPGPVDGKAAQFALQSSRFRHSISVSSTSEFAQPLSTLSEGAAASRGLTLDLCVQLC